MLMIIAPDRADSHTAQALINWRDWRFSEALAEAHSATSMREISNNGQGFAHQIYGFLLIESGKPDEALKEYEKAENMNGGDPLVQHHLGHPYFVKRNFDEALKHYQASIDLQPGWFTGHYWIGRVFEEKGDYLAAISEFETRDNLAGENKDRTTRFYDDLRDAVRQDPKSGYWKRRLDHALKDSPQDLYYIATLYARLADRENAYEYLKNACKHRAFYEGLLFDLCWDHSDQRFQAIVRGIGLL
jgi:tetratricopeptide (TPR) repeat protein